MNFVLSTQIQLRLSCLVKFGYQGRWVKVKWVKSNLDFCMTISLALNINVVWRSRLLNSKVI